LIASPTPGNLARAIDILKQGGLVAFPTETVYGLGADASNSAAVAKIFAAKGRPQDHPVIVHIADLSQLGVWAVDIPRAAHLLAERFWPGPLTLILRRAPGVNPTVTGGQATIGLRIPSHPVARQLLRNFGDGIAAPSANRFGRVSPTTAQHVEAEFGGSIDLILDGGACEVGIESTIVDLSRGRAVLLRPGRIGAAEIASVLGEPVQTAYPENEKGDAPRAPGTLEAHYAPVTPLSVVDGDGLQREIAAGDAVLAFAAPPEGFANGQWISASRSAVAFAHDLYANLRRLDTLGCARILVEQPPAEEEWMAVNDRLRRAAAGSSA
jgi:L-threonylcarbamoyladenylate synthase